MTSCLATILGAGGAELRGTPLKASTTRILGVDDFEPWRRYVSTALQTNPRLEIIGEALDGLEAVLKTQQLQPDLILLDIGLPKLNGIEAGRRIRERSPKSKILFVSEDRCPEIAEKALYTGAGGYVVKSAAAGDLLPAVEAVLNERRFVSASLLVMISPSRGRHDAIDVATEPDTTNPVCSDL